ncbi:MAG: penicillin-binding transpeptidase domain-containing protein [Bacteroidota bacterium]
MLAIDNDTVATRRRPHRDARRIYLLGGGILLGLMVIAGRLVQIQAVRGDLYAEQARRQYESKVVKQAERGFIKDRNGNLLATNGVSTSFAADPRHIENPKKVAQAFAQALGEPYQSFYQKISNRTTSFVWLRRKVSGAARETLRNIEDDGLIKLDEPLRHFEYDSLGSQAIGATDIDNNGLNGIELFYNQQLRGTDGYIVMQRDARGRRRPDVDLPQSQPEHGDGLELTLDINIQSIVEDELKKGIARSGAVSGTAIVLDPKTGEILSMASYPTYNPNDLRDASQSAIRVRAITDMYEPGSTMKLVTAAAALEEKVVSPEERIDGEGGTFMLASHAIHDDHPGNMMTFREAVEHSSNIVFAKIATRIAPPRFYKYVRDFGFGIVSGIDLPGEARGDVKKPAEFRDGTQAFMAFGYQLAVTPLQLACAYGAVANGGVMMKPHLLKRRLDRDGGVIEEIQPQEIRRVISKSTADTLRSLLTDVVENGTGKEARIAGLKVAGKTGTAQQLSGGEYSKEKYNASFVGFFPADDPRITLLVLLDAPSNGYYGGQVAAPIFREIARRIAGVGVPDESPSPSYGSGEIKHVANAGRLHLPDLRGIDAEAATAIGMKFGYRVMARGNGKMVARQEPAPGTLVEAHGVITLTTAAPEEMRVMPDLRGMSLRRALNLLNACHIRPQINGTGGTVRGQSPAPNAPLPNGAGTATLNCGEPLERTREMEEQRE